MVVKDRTAEFAERRKSMGVTCTDPTVVTRTGSIKDKLKESFSLKKKASKTSKDIGKSEYDLNDGLTELEKLIGDLKLIHTKILTCGSMEQEKVYMKELEQKNDVIFSKSKSLATTLKQFAETLGDNTKTADQRIKHLQFKAQSQRLKQVMITLNEAELSFCDKRKAMIRKQMVAVGAIPTDSDIEVTLEEGRSKIFTQDFITTEEARNQLDNSMIMMLEREKELKKLEQDIQCVHSMFHDIQFLINEQGETIDRIEEHVAKAEVDVSDGKDKLKKAAKHKKSARRKKIIIISIALGVGALLLAIILLACLA